MYEQFSLVLTVNHACNMRCSYCYTGRKFFYPMPVELGRRAIDRALASLAPGGALDLGFFGGEPLLEAELVAALIAYARERARAAGVAVAPGLTTNGTVSGATAWGLMTQPDLALAVSCDGAPDAHDRHRRFADGCGSAYVVLKTMRRLLAAEKDFRVVMVVRPDTLDALPESIAFLRAFGVRHIDPTLDLWTTWRPSDVRRLEEVVGRCADLWRDGLPNLSVSWFDEKAALLTGVPLSRCVRCAFGNGEIAVAPSGFLYPCERLIGEDLRANPMRLPGHVMDGRDFLGPARFPVAPNCAACGECRIRELCNVHCRCSNFVRTGDCGRPDGLLCALNRACVRETARVLTPAPQEREPVLIRECEPVHS